jgi:uncharacterized protein
MPTEQDLRRILTETRVIALVGWSPRPERPSHGVAAFLARRGYLVIPVNPGQAGKMAPWGEVVRGSLAEIGGGVDMVDVFRNSEALPGLVEEVLADLPGVKVIWTQLGVVHQGAAERARAAGIEVVMNRCPAIDIPRLLGG